MIGAAQHARHRAHAPARPRIERAAQPPQPPARRSWWPSLLVGAACVALSFTITLQVIKPKPPSMAAAALAHAFVSDSRSMIAAVRTAGLKGSANVRGAIDAIRPLGNDRVSVTGWAGEVGNGGTPLDVLVFVDGENKLLLQTVGKHADVTGALGLADAATAHNVAFQGSLACAHGQKLIVVAVAESGDYGYFSPRVCP